MSEEQTSDMITGSFTTNVPVTKEEKVRQFKDLFGCEPDKLCGVEFYIRSEGRGRYIAEVLKEVGCNVGLIYRHKGGVSFTEV